MKEFSEKLDDLLDISSEIRYSSNVVEKVKVESNEEDVENDYKYARENIYNIIERGQDAISELMQEAKDSGNARMYEVLGQLIKTVGEQNQNLLNVHKQIKDITKETKSSPKNVTNALFVGSTAELQKMLKDKD
jgi:hypothetical protein